MMSAGPPGANATTNLTGLVGHACVCPQDIGTNKMSMKKRKTLLRLILITLAPFKN
jgi:hypothetical protein